MAQQNRILEEDKQNKGMSFCSSQALNKLKRGGISIKEKIILSKTDNGMWKCKNGYSYL